MWGTSKGDPFWLRMPCHECVRKAGYKPEYTTEDSASRPNIHFLPTPIDLTTVKSSRAHHDSTEVYLQWLASLHKVMPTRVMGVLTLLMRPHIEDDQVLKDDRIVVPAFMRSQVLQAIHLEHQVNEVLGTILQIEITNQSWLFARIFILEKQSTTNHNQRWKITINCTINQSIDRKLKQQCNEALSI